MHAHTHARSMQMCMPYTRCMCMPSRCSEHPSGGGAFAFRTPSGIVPKPGALPHLPYKDASEAIFNVWRPARW